MPRTRVWRAPTVEARSANPIACVLCGDPVLKRRRRQCEACMPKVRREHGLRAIREQASPQSQLGTRESRPPRRSLVQARDRAEARKLSTECDRTRYRLIARGVLAD